MDRCIGTHQHAGLKTYRCHSSRILFIRQENLPQPAAVAHSYRTAPPHPDLPIICDPSHIGGKRELIAPPVPAGHGLRFRRTHHRITLQSGMCMERCRTAGYSRYLDYILNLLVIRSEHQTTENLNELRRQIDECDNDLMDILAKRMRVCREIGTFKKEHNMTILQTGRYNEILDKRGAQGSLCGMDSDFVKQVFELIHEESVRQQWKSSTNNRNKA